MVSSVITNIMHPRKWVVLFSLAIALLCSGVVLADSFKQGIPGWMIIPEMRAYLEGATIQKMKGSTYAVLIYLGEDEEKYHQNIASVAHSLNDNTVVVPLISLVDERTQKMLRGSHCSELQSGIHLQTSGVLFLSLAKGPFGRECITTPTNGYDSFQFVSLLRRLEGKNCLSKQYFTNRMIELMKINKGKSLLQSTEQLSKLLNQAAANSCT